MKKGDRVSHIKSGLTGTIEYVMSYGHTMIQVRLDQGGRVYMQAASFEVI